MLNRRQFFASVTAGLAGASALAQPVTKEAGTFVLLHGTWHGGWVWRDVKERLEDLGHRVVTPTLTGCGERIHLTSPQVGLETHIQDIVNVIEYEELDEFLLLAHSFTGVAMTGALDRLKDRVRRVVFFDAIVPRPGRMSGVPRDQETGELPDWWKERSKGFIDGYQMDLWKDYPVEMLVPPENTVIVERLKRLITTHPAKTWTDELQLQHGGWENVPRAFIHCVGQIYRKTSDRMVGPAREAGWDFIELDIPRDGMLTHPDLVTDTLTRLL